MNAPIQARFASLALAALVTLGVAGGIDSLAGQGRSPEALLAQQGALVVAAAPVRSHS